MDRIRIPWLKIATAVTISGRQANQGAVTGHKNEPGNFCFLEKAVLRLVGIISGTFLEGREESLNV
jgi:hypothetical protein